MKNKAKKSLPFKFWEHNLNPITGFRVKKNDVNSDKAREYARKRKEYLQSL